MSPMHQLHPQAQDILQRIVERGEPVFETMTPDEARRIADGRVIETAGPGPEVGDVEETSIEVDGRRVGLRFYRPKARVDGVHLPVLIYYHGGGFVVGNLDTVDSLCRHIVLAVGCLVISVDYSLAPEHKFPAAVEDAYGAARWIMANVEDLGGDSQRVAIAGESSGGTLVAAVTQMAKRAGDDWKLVQQIMVYPALDLHADSESYRRLADGYFLTQKKMRWFIDHYLESADQADDPRASPLRCSDFAGLPPALVVTADLDPLVDEGNAYAVRLREAGVQTTLNCYEGWPHGFAYWRDTEAYHRMLESIIASLRKAFSAT